MLTGILFLKERAFVDTDHISNVSEIPDDLHRQVFKVDIKKVFKFCENST
jgi:hypothetical protein